MGRSSTPKYRIEMQCIHFVNKRKEVHSFAYNGKKPSEESAKEFRDKMNKSMDKGESNEHLKGIQSAYSKTTIVNQKTGEIAAIFNPPMFELI